MLLIKIRTKQTKEILQNNKLYCFKNLMTGTFPWCVLCFEKWCVSEKITPQLYNNKCINKLNKCYSKNPIWLKSDFSVFPFTNMSRRARFEETTLVGVACEWCHEYTMINYMFLPISLVTFPYICKCYFHWLVHWLTLT